ncbi:6-phosphogluconolactonase [Hypnocyclicus thermotrophus]|uniref:6-phosphogluconolactonase n=1 Tax=Hypnocyclicus thermotrophus TaxID=1627895 RepID=A0AA46I7B7_9FUSO|nr:6-phosphogluconolactonase [Hypnocyclicus thermotrophus]TDT72428.1 6-phosphogluconolactonase [Hypnocyclicus thermotrophus]
MNKINIGQDLNNLSQKLVNYFFKIYLNKPLLNIALSGGNTPKKFFQLLSEKKEINWNNINIFIVDDRHVSLDSNDSNYNLIKSSLIDHINIPKENFHFIPYLKTLEESKEFYENDIVKFFNLSENEYPNFDFILLGIGNDGHTASLFPENFNQNSIEITTVAKNINRINYDRVSLDLQTLNNSNYIVFLVSGKNKKEILQKVLKKDKKYPASYIKAKKELIFFVDNAAY